ncbi:MAG: hypothetical protein PHE43_02105 [Candidatus Nanoarchaeia archaeon]|nr:hypothetical protein [Candidatus Nanoarchaeia archaeon]
MKKRLLIFLAILLIIPFTYATITIDPLTKSQYNIGDTFLFSGSIEATEDIDGYFETAFVCSSSTTTMPRVQLYLSTGQKKLFPSDIIVPPLTTSSSMVGTCTVKSSVIEQGEVKETKSTSEFTVSKELKGLNFNIDKTRLQVGTEFTLTALITKLDNTNVEGSAEIYITGKDNSTDEFFLGTTAINNGKIDFTYKTTAIPPGKYGIKIVARDPYTNEKTFENILEFELTNELSLNANIDFPETLPGKIIKITGDVKNIFLTSIAQGNLKVIFNGNEYKTTFADGIIDYSITVPTNIKSGKHVVTVEVDDGVGNKAVKEITISINPISTTLSGIINGKEHVPGDVLEITPMLYDQANDVMPGEIAIEILDPNGNVLYQDSKQVNTKGSYKLDNLAEPGSYKLKLSFSSLKTEDTFTITAISKLDIGLENETLVITNVGNVGYKNIIHIDMNSGTYLFDEKINLDSGEKTYIDLSSKVETGTYDILITHDESEKRFTNVYIVGKKQVNLNVFYIILIILIFLIVIYSLILKNRKIFKVKLPRFIRKTHISSDNLKPISREPVRKHKLSSIGRFGTANEKDTEYFRNKVVEDIKKSQSPEGQGSSYFNRKKEDKPRDGSFKMFD